MKIDLGAGFPRVGIESTASLARALGLSLGELEMLARTARDRYKPKQKAKPDGTTRQIDRPLGRLKEIQSRIYRRLLKRHGASEIAHGGVPERSHVTAARVHVRSAAVGTLDILRFFDSVTHHHVYSLFVSMDCSPDVARLLTQLTTFQGHLAQGSPASTPIANLLLMAFDRAIERAAQTRGVEASRVVDDLILSGQGPAVTQVMDAAVKELRRLRLRPNRKKRRLMTGRDRKSVCNLSVSAEVSIPKRPSRDRRAPADGMTKQELRSRVRAARRFGISDRGRRSLEGKLHYARSLHPKFAAGLLADLRRAPVADEGRGAAA